MFGYPVRFSIHYSFCNRINPFTQTTKNKETKSSIDSYTAHLYHIKFTITILCVLCFSYCLFQSIQCSISYKLVNCRVQLIYVSLSTYSSSFEYVPIHRSDISTKRYVLTIAIIVQSNTRYQQFYCISLGMLITLQKVSNSSVSTIRVNPTVSVPISTKDDNSNQNESNHRNHSKDLELVLNVTKNHKVKAGHGISDNLPGIGKNRYGQEMVDSCFVVIC